MHFALAFDSFFMNDIHVLLPFVNVALQNNVDCCVYDAESHVNSSDTESLTSQDEDTVQEKCQFTVYDMKKSSLIHPTKDLCGGSHDVVARPMVVTHDQQNQVSSRSLLIVIARGGHTLA